MARKAETETDGHGSAVRSNGYDPDAVKSFVARVESLEGEIEVFRSEFKERCEAVKEDIAAVIGEALAAGIPKKELKAKLKERATRRKADAIRAKLKSHEQDNFDNLGLALGDFRDTALGKAALAGATA